MGIGGMFGFGDRSPIEKNKLVEKDILSLVEPKDGGRLVFSVVGEEIRLMGSEDKTFTDGEGIIVLKAGDNVRFADYVPFDKYENLSAAISGAEIPDLVDITVFNNENKDIGLSYYVRRSNLEGRKIKINTAMKSKYSQ